MTLVYRVPGISCDHCKRAIETEVAKVDHVAAVDVDVDQRTVTVTGDPDDGDVRAAIDEAGYEVGSMKAV